MSTHFGGGCNLRKLLVGDDNGPGFSGFTEHLLRLELPTFFQNQVSYVLCRCRRRVEHFLHAVHECHCYLRRALYLTALYLHFARRVRFLRLTRVALRQKLHTRRRSRIQRVELDARNSIHDAVRGSSALNSIFTLDRNFNIVLSNSES
ncbi:hypothetical protein LR48_Vigan09g030300 [Vigna angularis]|uniref:Uncharacterized protein n=1 Tax=Phaseolus angularis TaxID=3914 RepID=A0A0L9VAF3_PHAAN|nr:hypothetical protein LR48_Vigan09g030300 [Vigna angularis]